LTSGGFRIVSDTLVDSAGHGTAVINSTVWRRLSDISATPTAVPRAFLFKYQLKAIKAYKIQLQIEANHRSRWVCDQMLCFRSQQYSSSVITGARDSMCLWLHSPPRSD